MQYIQFDSANGFGMRSSIFFSGCSLHCKGCWNPSSWNTRNGEPFTQHTVDMIVDNLAHPAISGLSMLGGEPFENLDGSLPLVKAVRERYGDTKSIWSWSGYYLDEILADPDKKTLLSYLDVLVEGRFILSKRDLSLYYRGSSNQRVLDVPRTLTEGKAVWEEGIPDKDKYEKYSVPVG